ncbi:hypothetical protein LTR84_010321 [Exophiala bonariae]|uniref:AB hydrolase-1 domain-containing protein n=1 Tax=Exophiala bonariae TaxID=1690606 RepID=A0AAV9MU70_9EURO|nr:hypothetical protein LTR84_010321 [Exophiala bonariae]
MALFRASKTINLSTGHIYAYLYHRASQSSSLPTLLFLHGFPSSAYDFRYQVDYFAPKGYGVLVPDLLGYGGTSQPIDVQKYSMTKMAREIVEILDHEGMSSVVGISHDWGSALLSTLLRQHHQRFDAFVFMATYYGAAHPYSSDSVYDYGKLKAMAFEKFGFNAFGHTMFLGDSERAGKLLDDNIESFYDLVWAKDQELWKSYFRREGGIEEWVTKGKRGDVAAWVGDEEDERRKIIESWRMGNGFTPKCMWYKQLLDGVSVADEPGKSNSTTKYLTSHEARGLTEWMYAADDSKEPLKISQPILLMIEQKDVKGRGEGAEQTAQEVSEQVYVEKCDTYHFMMLEDSRGTNEKLERFFNQQLGRSDGAH